MPEYVITATYHVEKTLVVTVAEGADPKDPSAWGEIHSEDENDCHLYDVKKAELDA